MKAYQQSITALYAHFNTNATTGLSMQEAQQRRALYGANSDKQPLYDAYAMVVWRQVKQPRFCVPFFFFLSIAVMYNAASPLFIINGILLCNLVLNAWFEYYACRLFTRHKAACSKQATVVRDGAQQVIAQQELVPGDIILLAEGAYVPADIRLITTNDLYIDESKLTGEFAPLLKSSAVIAHDARMHDQYNMAFQGSYVTAGSGQGIVIATGAKTHLHAQRSVRLAPPVLTIQQDMQHLLYTTTTTMLIIASVMVLLSYLQGLALLPLIVLLAFLYLPLLLNLSGIALLLLVQAVRRLGSVTVQQLEAVEIVGQEGTSVTTTRVTDSAAQKDAAAFVLYGEVTLVDVQQIGRQWVTCIRTLLLSLCTTYWTCTLFVLYSMVAGLPLPYTAAQLVWLYSVLVLLLATIVTSNLHDPSSVRRENIAVTSLYAAIPIAIGATFLHYWYAQTTSALLLILLCLLGYVWQLQKFSLRLVAVTCGALLLILAVLYIPFLQQLVGVAPLRAQALLTVLGCAIGIIALAALINYGLPWKMRIKNKAGFN